MEKQDKLVKSFNITQEIWMLTADKTEKMKWKMHKVKICIDCTTWR